MHQNERAPVVGFAAGDAEKFADTNIDRHADAADGTAHGDAFAIDFDMPDAAIGATIARLKLTGKEWGRAATCSSPGSTPTDSN